MKAALFTLVLLAGSLSQAATVCTSQPNQYGGTVAVTIDQNEQGQPTISLFAQGGMAHYVSSEGPFVAQAQREVEGTSYTFKDNFGQEGQVTLIATSIGGKVVSVASTNFGLFTSSSLFCK